MPKINANVPNAWMTEIIAGETRPEHQDTVFQSDYPVNDGSNTKQDFIECVDITHSTFMLHHNAFVTTYDNSKNELNNARAAHAHLGYHIHVTQVEVAEINGGTQVEIAVTAMNSGVAPFYYDLALTLTCPGVATMSEQGVDSLLPGQSNMFLFTGIPHQQSCLEAVSLGLDSSMAYPSRQIRFSQGVDGTLVLDLPLSSGSPPSTPAPMSGPITPSPTNPPTPLPTTPAPVPGPPPNWSDPCTGQPGCIMITADDDTPTTQSDAENMGKTFYTDPSLTKDWRDIQPDVPTAWNAYAGVFKSLRWADPVFTYTVFGLTPGGSYSLVCGFIEQWSNAYSPNSRVFDVFVNDVITFNDVDIFASVGSEAAMFMDASVVADSQGHVNIRFNKVSGIASPGVTISKYQQCFLPSNI